MAISRVTTWSSGQVLTASALNAEIDNVLNNALSLISPLTAILAAGGFAITGLSAGTVSAPSLSITGDTDTGVYRPAADVMAFTGGGVDIVRASTNAGGINYLSVIAGSTTTTRGVVLIAEGADTNVNMSIEAKGTGVVSITDLAYNNIMLIQVYS